MASMVKTQVYLPADELKALHRVAKEKHMKVAELVREAVRATWLKSPPKGPVGLFDGENRGSSSEHDAAFDEP